MTATRAQGPIQCAPWCAQRDGHPGEKFVEDQRCKSTAVKIRPSLMRTVEGIEPDVEVYREHGPDFEPRVVIYQASSDSQIDVTPTEAWMLVALLEAVAAL
ncbi:hypothetical protein GCM10023221_04400 [Luteimicrobium xylanilyticum]|uniref:Uncharacterized protein n=1 Tax=Luteimicrobium xylanilyticum TaxID=1133546 RepID=A0A5P9Q766_9MICO|nr:hypothetical protein [Luteimicrobium xylanilyticum]QFU97267.1 hypothetical protein KDY119_00761 [Luteimicrobium xylanilyticum]